MKRFVLKRACAFCISRACWNGRGRSWAGQPESNGTHVLSIIVPLIGGLLVHIRQRMLLPSQNPNGRRLTGSWRGAEKGVVF